MMMVKGTVCKLLFGVVHLTQAGSVLLSLLLIHIDNTSLFMGECYVVSVVAWCDVALVGEGGAVTSQVYTPPSASERVMLTGCPLRISNYFKRTSWAIYHDNYCPLPDRLIDSYIIRLSFYATGGGDIQGVCFFFFFFLKGSFLCYHISQDI